MKKKNNILNETQFQIFYYYYNFKNHANELNSYGPIACILSMKNLVQKLI